MKILITSQHFWPEGFRINDVAKSLIAEGAEVTVLTGKPNYPQGTIFPGYQAGGRLREQHDGIDIVRVPLVGRGKGARGLALNYLCFIFSAMLHGAWELRKEKPDIIFVYGTSPILQAIPSLFIGWLKRVPVVIWVQDLWPESLAATGYIKNRLVLAMVRQVVMFIYRHADLLLVQSEAFHPQVCAMASHTPVRYYPNSVDASFAQSGSGEMLPIKAMSSPFPILFAGNIGSAQSVDVIVEAAERLRDTPDIQFVIVGDGSQRDWMLEQKQARGLDNLHLPGRFPVEAMPDLMQRAGALLVSLTDQSIFAATVPNKVQAYMAAGRPIIASLNGEGARLVTEAKAGLTAAAENVDQLVDAILRLYQMPQSERDQMGANGQSYYRQHFDHDKLVKNLMALFSDVLRSHA